MVQEGQDFLWPGMSDNDEVTITDVGSGESGGLGSMAGEGEVKLSRELGRGVPTESPRVYELDTLRQNIDPTAIQRRRPEAAREADAAQDAPITTDPLTWASDPNHYDYPGIDTGPTFREVEGDEFDTDGFLDGVL